jgi:hypothetical protein
MVNFPGRNGRRRRVLNEEVLSASSSHAILRAFDSDDASHEAPRYSDAAGVEHHPQVTDFVPRRYRTIGLLAFAGGVTATALAVLHYFAPTVAAGLGWTHTERFEIGSLGNLAGWFEAITLLVASITCAMVYSIRRHRIDDIRGRYRIWLAASAACLVMSVNSIAALHQVIAHSLGHVTGWTALRGDAFWWLATGGLPLAWIVFRAVVDALECRLAASLLMTAILCYAAAAGSYFGAVSSLDFRIESMITGTAVLAGHWLLLLGVVSYARFVILDAQGLIAARPRASRTKTSRAAKSQREGTDKESADDPAPTVLSAVGYSRRQHSDSVPTAGSRSSNQWVDGSRPERDHYEHDGEEESGDDRKLNKSDRKRMRKLKTQNRAA